ncbi:uncharacterized protein LOC113564545 [Drosophila erecta]|uniref:uncharacterized protein LOC113564545 n=1 Tax=Drosophila erecta TaxID=7220 RepID=UPI00017824A1|nr:uncharacterized protein LOC113564545 [Drosophila erecta]
MASQDADLRTRNRGAGDPAVADFLAEVEKWTIEMPSRSSSTSSSHRSTSTSTTSFGEPGSFYRRSLRRERRILKLSPPSMNALFLQQAKEAQKAFTLKRIVFLYLGLVLAPVIMELGPRIEFPELWKQTGKFHFCKERRLAMTFTNNTTRVLIRSFLSAAVPLYCMLCMAHPNRFLLCAPHARGCKTEVPANVSAYFLGLLPYVIRLHAGFARFVKDTWLAYNDHVLNIAETFNTWRLLIYLNQIIQLVYSFELVLLMAQGLMGFLQARRIYKLIAVRGNRRVMQLEQNKSKFWYSPSDSTMDVYWAFKLRASSA